MISRAELLSDLLEASRPMDELGRELKALVWDSDDELVVLTPDHLKSVLVRYVGGQLSGDYVSAWAEAIEGRDDIGIEETSREKLSSMIFELANQRINRRLSPILASRFIQELGAQ
jgi:hypothetical protein